MVYQPEDLDLLERTLLGVLSIGLPPSKAAGSDTFRVDHVTAVIAGMQEADAKDAYLVDEVRVSPEFRARLRKTIEGLEAKGLVASPVAGMPAAAGGFEEGLLIDLVDPDEQPAVLDRYLSQLCMEVLFNIPAVYPFLMERYSASGEVWRRLREGGYARD
ncbi:MAG: hypothetical protein AB7N24_21070 [Dehalococcoidia bacterium]